MNKLISTLRNIFSIEELRNRILTTLLFLAVFRLGSYIVLPGVDPARLDADSGGLFGLLNTFLGGAFSNASIFALGIMPYITASIVLQLLTVAVPYFQRMQKEGESGRKRINQLTRVLTVFIAGAQSFGYLAATIPAEAIRPEYASNLFLFNISSVVILVSGTIFLMWMGEKITERGIGNGISMIIMIGIVSRFPAAILQESVNRGMTGAIFFVAELVVLFFIVMAVVLLTQGTRRIPVQYARQVIGNKVYGGQRQFIPLKINSAGVMPIIFAQSLMFLPSLVAQAFVKNGDNEFANNIIATLSDFTSLYYNLLFAFLIIVFTYFYTAISVNPNQISEDMKRNNGFIPGVKPGEETTNYISTVIDRITLPGALFLVGIAVLPSAAAAFGVVREFSQFFGGTSLLIMVGVVLDTLQQIESYLLMRHYESMMASGKFSSELPSVATMAQD